MDMKSQDKIKELDHYLGEKVSTRHLGTKNE